MATVVALVAVLIASLPLIPGKSQGLTPARAGRTAVVSGVVVEAATGRPVEAAVVTMTARSVTERLLTDDKGRFVFASVPADSTVTVEANKPGFLLGGIGAGIVVSGGALWVAADEWIRDLRVELARPASVSGVVTDEVGDPVVGVVVHAMTVIAGATAQRLAAAGTGITDERGRYRIGDLLPGDYAIVVPPSPPSEVFAASTRDLHLPAPFRTAEGIPMGYPPTFAPSTRRLEASLRAHVSAGEDVGGVDVVLIPSVLRRVSGTVIAGAGQASGLALQLRPAAGDACPDCLPKTTTDSAGRFVFDSVPDGEYVLETSWANGWISVEQSGLSILKSRTPYANGTAGVEDALPTLAGRGFSLMTTRLTRANRSLWGRLPVTVGSDIDGVVLPLEPTKTVVITVNREVLGTAPTLDPRLTLRLDPADVDSRLPALSIDERPEDEGSAVRIAGVEPGVYFLRAVTTEWIVKRLLIDGRDMTGQPFDLAGPSATVRVDLLVTNQAASLTGLALDTSGQPVTNGTVVVFPQDTKVWSRTGYWPAGFGVAETDLRGRFAVTGLPAGEYFAIAVAGRRAVLESQWLAQAAGLAQRLSLYWGEAATLALTVRSVR